MDKKQLNTTPVEFNMTVTANLKAHVDVTHVYDEYGYWITFESNGYVTGCSLGGYSSGRVVEDDNLIHLYITAGSESIDLGRIEDPTLSEQTPWEPGWNILSFSKSNTITYKEKIMCNKFAGILSQDFSSQEVYKKSFFASYHDDYDGGGLPPQFAGEWYEPIPDELGRGVVEITYSIDNTVVSTSYEYIDAEVKLYNLAAKYLDFTVDHFVYIDGMINTTMPLGSEELAGSVSWNGNSIDGPYNKTADIRGDYSDYPGESRAILDGNSITVYSTGGSAVVNLDLTCPSFTITVDGIVRNMDDRPVVGPYTLQLDGTYDAVPILLDGGNGTLENSLTFKGIWEFGFSNPYDESIVMNDDGGMYDATDGSILMGSYGYDSGFRNYVEIGEPEFPFNYTFDTAIVPYKWQQARDGRVEYSFPDLSYENAVKFTAPMSKDILTFEDGVTWTVDSGAATFADYGDGTIRVNCSVDSTSISNSLTYKDLTLAGGRYIRLDYLSDDTSSITVEIDGNQYTINPGENIDSSLWIDLLLPTNRTTADTNQSPFANNMSWGHGIHEINTIKFIGLRSGKYYNFKFIQLKRKLGSFEAHIFRCPQVVLEAGDTRENSEYSLYTVGTTVFDTIYGTSNSSDAKITRIGVILVDGIIAMELFGMGHVYVPGTYPYWTHFHLTTEDEQVAYPTNGLVTKEALINQLEFDYLPIGITTITGTEWIPTLEGYFANIKLPCMESNYTLSFSKYFQGSPLIRIINKKKTSVSGTIETYIDITKDPIATESITVPETGILLCGSKQQVTSITGTITQVNSATEYVVSGLTQDCEGLTLYAVENQPGDNITPVSCTILTHNQSTNVITVDHTFNAILAVNAKVYVRIPYLYKVIFGDDSFVLSTMNRMLSFATTIVDIGGKTSLIDSVTGILNRHYRAYVKTNKLYLGRSDNNGTDWNDTEVISDASDISYPSLHIHKDTTQSLSLIYQKGTNSICKIVSLDDGFTFGSETEL